MAVDQIVDRFTHLLAGHDFLASFFGPEGRFANDAHQFAETDGQTLLMIRQTESVFQHGRHAGAVEMQQIFFVYHPRDELHVFSHRSGRFLYFHIEIGFYFKDFTEFFIIIVQHPV